MTLNLKGEPAVFVVMHQASNSLGNWWRGMTGTNFSILGGDGKCDYVMSHLLLSLGNMSGNRTSFAC